MAKQGELIVKTDAERAEEIRAIRGMVTPLLGLPSKTTELVGVLSSMSKEDLQGVASLCKSVTPKLRQLAVLSAEMAGQ